MTMRRHTAFFVVLVTAAVLLWVPVPAGGVAGFGDVDSGLFYTESVQWMVDNGITTGTSPTCFSPGDPVTRGQAAAFMWRMEGSPTGFAAASVQCCGRLLAASTEARRIVGS
jgi:hypothetical protein